MKPRFRHIEAYPVQQDGEDFLLLNDPKRLAPQAVVPAAMGELFLLFDGTRTVQQIADATQLDEDFLTHLVEELDENYLLDSLRFRQFIAARDTEYSASATRPAAFAGLSYPDNATELSQLFNTLSAEGAQLLSTQETQETPVGIVVPHIDFGRGGAVEALAYDALRNETFDTLLVFGIAHQGVRYPFCATTKDYATPLGLCRTDKKFVEELRARVGEKLTAEEMAHRDEHSIEFVAAFLQHHENLRNAKIVPILCGGFFRETESGASPASTQDIGNFCVALREVVQEREARGEKIGFIASVDLAHIGAQFGDDISITPDDLRAIESEDRAFLRLVANGDAEGLHAHISRDDNARKIDAHPALYTLLHAFPNLRAQLLHYAQAFSEEENIVVSFASMTLFEDT